MPKFAGLLLFLLLLAFSVSGQEAPQFSPYNFHSFTALKTAPAELSKYSKANDHPEFGKLPFNAQCEDCFELIEKRTEDSRYFIKSGSGGDAFYIQQSYGPMHFQKNGRWHTIDPRLKELQSAIFSAPNQPQPVVINLKNNFSEIQLSPQQIIRFNGKPRLIYTLQNGKTSTLSSSTSTYTAGDDGVVITDFWTGIDRQQIVSRGAVKTSYILHQKLNVAAGSEVIFEETITIPSSFTLAFAEDYFKHNNKMLAAIELRDASGVVIATIQPPVVFDESHTNASNHTGYRLKQLNDTSFLLHLIVDADWLNDPDRQYPVTVDPLVSGSSTHLGSIGFKSGNICWDANQYCSYNLSVTVPGKSALTNAYFNAQYISNAGGCGGGSNCFMSQAGYQVIGPCGTSPNLNNYWTCPSPGGNSPGTCSGDNLTLINTIYCVAPSCNDYNLNFEMRTFHCSCPTSGCNTACHIMPAGSWIVTVEARTVETTPAIQAGNDTICEGEPVTLTTTSSFGKPGYSYNWLPGNATGATITVQPAVTTTYSAIATDACGGKDTTSITIYVNEAPEIIISKSDISCYGQSNGSATAQVTGSSPFTYSWSTGSANPTISNLSAGNYYLTVTDQYGCHDSASSTIAAPTAPLTSSINSNNVVCNGGSTGLATVMPTGGTPPYSFYWNTTPVQTTATASGLVAGNYAVTVTDDNGCFTTDSVTISEPPLINLSVDTTNASCNGASDGSASAIVSGGTGNFTFTWSGYPDTGAVLSYIPAGSYTVTATDSVGCTADTAFYISEPAAIIITTSTTDVDCFGAATGSAVASASGGAGNLSYSWNTAPQSFDSTITNMVAGTYTVNVTDQNGCSDSASVTISQNPVINLSMSSTTASCHGLADGTATVAANGGFGNFTYNWNTTPAQQTDTATGLAAGVYHVTVTDSLGCPKTDSVTITEPQPLQVSFTPQGTLCNGSLDGSATTTVTGGTFPYSFSWNTNPPQSGSILQNIGAGTYQLTLTDTNNCTLTDSVTITEPLKITPSVTTIDANCNGAADGSATVSATGGTGNYSYKWSYSTAQTNSTANFLSAGNYSVTVTDSNGCSDSISFQITEPTTPLSATLSVTDETCSGKADGSITTTPAGGTPPYSFKWNTTPAQITSNLQNLAAGSYTLTVTDSNNCEFIISDTVASGVTLQISATTTPISCFGKSDGAIKVFSTGGAGPYQYSWSTGAMADSITGLPSGSYSVTATDINGCSITGTYTLQPGPDFIVDAGPTQTTYAGGNVQLFPDVQPPGNYSYSWTPTEVVNDSTAENPTAMPMVTTTFTLQVTSIANNCSRSDTVTILVVQDDDFIVIPNAFSPNGDHQNEVFFVAGEVQIVNLKIYNRWGNLVYEGSQPWDGTMHGQPMPVDTYVYTAIILDPVDQREVPITGNVTLIR